MRVWNDLLSPSDREVTEARGHVKPGGLTNVGRRPALLVIDATVDFTGDRPEPILASIKRFPESCGEKGWSAVRRIKELLDAARRAGVPIIYTKVEEGHVHGNECWRHRSMAKNGNGQTLSNVFPDMIQPRAEDPVLRKRKPSAFFGTPLLSMLTGMQVDTLLICGGVTSGCIRATVTDGFSHDFKVVVVEDCVFDRLEIAHRLNLFEMHQKYADVVSLSEAQAYLSELRSRPEPTSLRV